MVRAYHVILGAYGFWLPNDPRGSWSTYVGSRKLYHFGPATKTSTRRSVAAHAHNTQLRTAAKTVLLRPPVSFTGLQARSIAYGFGEFIEKNELPCFACAIMPDHAHLILGRHAYSVEQMVNLLKGAATNRMLRDGLHPFADQRDNRGKLPHCWAQSAWYVYLDTDEDIFRAIKYTNENPIRDGHKPQTWKFIHPFPIV